jgi:DNA-binding transcriptional MerR regulator
MPRPKRLLNAFTATEVNGITGLSRPMIDYLSREGYLCPSYAGGRVRGKVRYYSYRDLVVARIIYRLTESGIELRRVKKAIQELSLAKTWLPEMRDSDHIGALQWLVTDGKQIMRRSTDGFLDELNHNGQRSFAFVISVRNIQREIKENIPHEKMNYFSMRNRRIRQG